MIYRAMLSTVICIIFMLTSLSIVSCGKKNSPKPPEYLAPVAVRFFTASGVLEGINLNWLPPDKTAKGDELIDLGRFLIYRSPVEDGEADDFETIQEIVVASEPGQAFEKDKQYTAIDKDVKPGYEYDYFVVPVNLGGTKGGISPILRVKFVGEASIISASPTVIQR